MSKYELHKTYHGAPDQCQAIGSGGDQCRNSKLDGSQYCAVHGGNVGAQAKVAENISNYRLAKYQERLMTMAKSPILKSLRDEIGILRMVLEDTLNKAGTHGELGLMMYSQQIGDIALKIEKLVVSCNKLDKNLGNFLDKEDVIQLGIEIVGILSKHVKDTTVLGTVGAEIAVAIERITEARAAEEAEKE